MACWPFDRHAGNSQSLQPIAVLTPSPCAAPALPLTPPLCFALLQSSRRWRARTGGLWTAWCWPQTAQNLQTKQRSRRPPTTACTCTACAWMARPGAGGRASWWTRNPRWLALPWHVGGARLGGGAGRQDGGERGRLSTADGSCSIQTQQQLFTAHPAPPAARPRPLQKLYCPLPVVHITAVQAKDVRRAGVYSAPIYRGKARTGLRYIDQLQLRTDQPAAKWVLRGAAVLCSTD